MKRRHRLLLMPVIAGGVIAGGVASGYWSAPGGGSGSAGTSVSEAVTLTPGLPSDDLFPGDTSDVVVTAANPNAYAVHIGSLELDPTAGDGGYGVDAEHAGCPVVAVLTYAPQTHGGSGWTVPAASGGADGEVSVDLTDAITMSFDAPGACQGAAFVVHLVPIP